MQNEVATSSYLNPVAKTFAFIGKCPECAMKSIKNLCSHSNYVVMFCKAAEWFISFTKHEQADNGMGEVRHHSRVSIKMPFSYVFLGIYND